MNFKFNIGDKVIVVRTKRTSREYSNTVNRMGGSQGPNMLYGND